ncbi:zinc finger-domain protein [Trypanosoma theileri]|uniref:Zinc finger-domain protein n=1 Tax=Trypanosoma theileri TaxID=67003 RepID=A0A1X0P164_9TRYP|nr:zinc finger-domain protein [Trypanosoma theileri]ORC90696.1 zinc finger-domain protein [Trypanosoma theileri]
MSFSVRAGNSPISQRSPASQPYMSPQMLPQSMTRYGMPPFSLTGSDEVYNNHSNNNNNNTNNNVSTSSSSLPVKKSGTDPTRYKTTMCRNWETGSCTFRGCTFAHGVEELRAPTRIDHYRNSNMEHRQIAPGKTSPLYSTGALGTPSSPRIEQLLKMLYAEIRRERDLVAVHVEANRTLESLLKKEQVLHEQAKVQLESAKQKLQELTCVVLQTSEELNTFLNSCSISEAQRSRITLLASKLTEVIPQRDGTSDKAEGEENRVKELLKALQECQSSENAVKETSIY